MRAPAIVSGRTPAREQEGTEMPLSSEGLKEKMWGCGPGSSTSPLLLSEVTVSSWNQQNQIYCPLSDSERPSW